MGKGVFAGRRYGASSVVGEILGQLISDAAYGSRYCMDLEDGRVLEPQPPFRYVNHSCEPNCELDLFDLLSTGEGVPRRRLFLVTLREVKPGEELTIAYNWGAAAAITCRCGAPTCCGSIVDPDQLSAVFQAPPEMT